MRQIQIRVIPNARQNSVEASDDGTLKVRVMAPAVDGKANKAVIRQLADYLGVKKNTITIVKGDKSRDKTIEIDTDD